jgi:hypothetical protein
MFPMTQAGGLGLFSSAPVQMGGKDRRTRRHRRKQRGGMEMAASSAVKAVQDALEAVRGGPTKQDGGRRRRSKRRGSKRRGSKRRGSRRSRKHGGSIAMLN